MDANTICAKYFFNIKGQADQYRCLEIRIINLKVKSIVHECASSYDLGYQGVM